MEVGKLPYKYLKTYIFNRTFLGVVIDAETSTAIDVAFTALPFTGFYVCAFDNTIWVDDIGALGMITQWYTNEYLSCRAELTTVTGYNLGDSDSLTVTAAFNNRTSLYWLPDRQYKYFESPIAVPGQSFRINFYIQPQQFVPIGALRAYINFSITLGFPEMEDERVTEDMLFNWQG